MSNYLKISLAMVGFMIVGALIFSDKSLAAIPIMILSVRLLVSATKVD